MIRQNAELFLQLHDPFYGKLDPKTQFGADRKFASKRLLITAAQNATPVEPTWWGILLTAADVLDAELVVIPMRYKNPTSTFAGSQRNSENWAPEVLPYLFNQRRRLNANLELLADIKIQPTAETPLTGAEGISHAASAIMGHTKLQLKTVPTPHSKMAKIMTTTGACTVENYTDSRAGKVGEFHHSFAACLVELDGDKFYLRQFHYDSKSKTGTDLATRYNSEGKSYKAPRALALGQGDTHVDAQDPAVELATDDMIKLLDPECVIYADLLDAYSCNHWHEKDPFNKAGKHDARMNDVKAEVYRAIEFIRIRAKMFPKIEHVVQASNHNDMLRRWVMGTDWKQDPTNSEFYLATALMMRQGARTGLHPNKLGMKFGTTYPDPFKYWTDREAIKGVRVLDLDEPYAKGGIELSMHGDMGPNGSRGSIKNLRRIGTRSVIFHSHTPGIDEGCYQAGTSTYLRLEYNHGASGWLNAHVAVNADSKRQLIVIVDGKYRL